MAQYNFSEDWNRFFDGLETRIANRQTLEKEYNAIFRKARSIEYDNSTDSACYYYMAAILCYFFYDNTDNPDDDKYWAIDMGKTAINSATRLLQDDEEFKVLYFVFELLGFLEKIDESLISPQSLLKKVQSINQLCPHIESIENTLIKNEALRDWFNDAYYFVLYLMLVSGKLEDDIDLKIEYASELKNGSTSYNKIVAYTSLADAYFDKGDYSEAQRYAILGKDILGSLSEYDDDDSMQKYWGFCWYLYAKCQKEVGDMDFALTLLEKGVLLGIPLCKKELTRLQDEGYCSNEEADDNDRKTNNYSSLEEEYGAKNAINGGLLVPNEQEYLDALKDIFDDGEISSREHKMMERLRISLGISEVRAKELEDSLQPQLTKEEQEYLEAYKDACENGAISDRSRRILDRLRVMYGISEERAQEIERL